MERKRHLKIGISSYTDTHTVLGVTGNAEFSGIVTALEFHGDGSNLTNITAEAPDYAGTAGFATVAGYAHTAGIATNATTAGSATTATAAATAYSLTGRPDIEINNLDVAGVATFKGDIYLGDSDVLRFGTGSSGFGDLQIYHDTQHSYIRDNGTGNLRLKTNNMVELVFGGTNEVMGQFIGNAGVGLYYNSSKKFETTQSGIIVTGIATADGFVGPLEGNVTGDLTGDVNAGVITAVTGNFTGNVTIGGTLTYEDVTNVDSIGIVTARDGIVVNTRGIHVLSGITTLQDLDAQDLNIRNITGSAATFTDSVSLYDNDKIFLGTSQEMEIFHGTLGNSFFTSTKPLYIKYGQSGQTHEMFIQNDSTTAAKFTDDASVELHYNGGKRLETVGGGVTVTGDLRVSGVVTAARFESTSSGTPSIDSPNNLDLNAANVAVSTDMSVGRNLTVVGFVSAANFYGDGSGLVNVPSQSYVGNAGVATYAQTAGIATLAENLTGNPSISITSATVGGTMTIQASNIYRSNADLTLTGGGPQSTRSQLVLTNGSNATLKADDDSGSVVLKAPVGSVQVLDVGVTTSTPFLRTGAAGTVRLDRGDGNFTGVVTATTFYGDFQGSGSGITGITATYADSAGIATYASTAGVSTSVTLVATNTASGFHYLTFVDTATGNENLRTDTSLRYVPETGELNIIGGNLTANSATLGSISASGLAGIGSLNVTGVATFQSAVTVQSNINLGELNRINFYTTNTKIYGDSNGLNIESAGNNDVLIKSNSSGSNAGDIILRTIEGGRIDLTGTGGVGIYHTDTALKLQTTGIGVTVFGTTETQQLNVSGVATFQSSVNLGQSDKLLFNGTTGLEIYENGTTGVIQANNTNGRMTLEVNNGGGGNSAELIQLRGTGNLISANFKPDSGVQLYGRTGSNSAEVKLETTAIGATVFGTTETQQLSVSGVSTFLDGGNGEIKVFESSGDPIIQKSGGGLFHFRTNNGFDIEDNSGNLFARYGSGGGGIGDGVSLYHNAVERVATTNAGVVVTGILTATSYRGDGSQLTGVLAASEAGISIQDDQSSVGVSTTIDFGAGLSVSPVSAGVVTVTGGSGGINDLSDGYAAGLSVGLGTGSLASDDGTDNQNVAIGYSALTSSTSGSDNVAIGASAAKNLTTGDKSVYIGANAASNVTTVNEGVAIGYNAGLWAGTEYGFTALGYEALKGSGSSARTTSFHNTAVGFQAGHSVINGSSYNCFFGYKSGEKLTSGSRNQFYGYDAGRHVTTGDNNICIGHKAGAGGEEYARRLTTGDNNIVIGHNAEATSSTVNNEITLGNDDHNKVRIPGIGVTFGDNSTLTDGYVLTYSSSTGEVTLQAAGGGIDPVIAGMIF